tara:strand:- start:302 stop:475 length:174 start_codon:yes stop_codon:yes gene_type:complete
LNLIFVILGTVCAVYLAGEVSGTANVPPIMIGISWFFALGMAMWTILEAWLLFQENQ